ncbi:MAG: hypothetical protein KC729_15040, partial [Candidatus Eisenbacteria bacterium]|nr:hypothetical protein [Candidatus Eisenbacteria bacterium]
GSFFALAAVYPDAKNRIRSLTGRAEREVSESAGSIAEEDRLPTISVHDVTIDPFRAVYNVPANGRDVAVSLAEFDLSGVDGETARPVTVPSIYPLRQIAIDPRGPRTYGITTHKVGWIVPATGVFVEIEQDPALTISWPSAIAFDTRSSRVIVTARNGGFSFDPETGAWARGTGFDRPLLALAFDEESDSFFGLEEAPGATQVSFLSRFNRDGALISSVPLSQPLSLESLREGRAQLIDRERWLVLLVSAHRSLPDGTDGFVEARVYLIDPSSGSLSRVRSEA